MHWTCSCLQNAAGSVDEACTASQLPLKVQISVRQPFTDTPETSPQMLMKMEEMHLHSGKNSHHSWHWAAPKHERSTTCRFCLPGKRVDVHGQTPSLYSGSYSTNCFWVQFHWFSVLYIRQYILSKQANEFLPSGTQGQSWISKMVIDAAICCLALCTQHSPPA